MCLYPKTYTNRKYTVTEKNGGVIPTLPVISYDDQGNEIYDDRVLKIEIPCGNCEECRKTKTREWQVRLTEEIKDWKYNYFLTLTFSPAQLAHLCKEKNLKECNAVAAYALRHCLERWRKTHKKSLRHWFITELGHEGTERIHMHGIIFSNEQLHFSRPDENNLRHWKYWKYGHVYVGDYCSLRTVNYIVKYINKIDTDHLGFKGQILASPGIGRTWIEKLQWKPVNYSYRPKNTIDYYTLNNGCRIKLPKYYANKLRNEEERELIWREFMDTEKITIAGNTYKERETDIHTIGQILSKAQEVNTFMGYGSDDQKWRTKEYNITRRMLESKINAMENLRKKREKYEKISEKFLKNLKV